MLQHEINLLDTLVSQESVSIFIAYMKINLSLSLQHNEFTVCTFCLYTPTFKNKNTLVMDKQGLFWLYRGLREGVHLAVHGKAGRGFTAVPGNACTGQG